MLQVLTSVASTATRDITLPAPGPTWIHIHWRDPLDAAKALSKEGTILNTCHQSADEHGYQYMIGVMPFAIAKKKLTTTTQNIMWSSPQPKMGKASTKATNFSTDNAVFLSEDVANERRGGFMDGVTRRKNDDNASMTAGSIMDRILEAMLGA